MRPEVPMFGDNAGMILALLALVTFVLFTIVKVLSYIRKVPPNRALLVSGVNCRTHVRVPKRVVTGTDENGKPTIGMQYEDTVINYRIVKGGMTLVIPVFQRANDLDMTVREEPLQVRNVRTNTAVPINVDAVSQLAIGEDDASIATAARLHLEKRPEEVFKSAKETLQGHLRAIIGQLTPEDLLRDREAFARQVQEVAFDDMAGLGFRIVSFVITELSDDNHYFENLGMPKIQEVAKEARVATANADRDATEQEQAAEKKKAEFTRDTNKAKADYDAEVATRQAIAEKAKDISLAEQDQILELRKADAAKTAAERRDMELNTEIRRPADAHKYETEQNAIAARLKAEQEAQATLVTAQNKAEATKAEGFASAEVIQKTGSAQADADRATGLAQAEVAQRKLEATAAGTKAQLMAEAEGKHQLAESLNAYEPQALRQVLGTQLLGGIPDVARAFAEAFTKVGEIRLIDFNSNGHDGQEPDVVKRFMDYVPEGLFKFLQGATALIGGPIDDIAVGMITKIAKDKGIDLTPAQTRALKQEIATRTAQVQPEIAATPLVELLEKPADDTSTAVATAQPSAPATLSLDNLLAMLAKHYGVTLTDEQVAQLKEKGPAVAEWLLSQVATQEGHQPDSAGEPNDQAG